MESLRRLVEGCAYNTSDADVLCDPAASAAINTCNAQGVHLEPNLGVSAAALMSNGFRNPVSLLRCPHLTRDTGDRRQLTAPVALPSARACMQNGLGFSFAHSVAHPVACRHATG